MTTYGSGGSRWWTGQNIGETGSGSTIFGTPSGGFVNPFIPSGYESLPSGNAADDAQFAAAAVKNKNNSHPVTISVENVQWYNIQGPYATQAAANAAIAGITVPPEGVTGQVASDNSGNPLGGIVSFAGTILNGFTTVFSGLSGTNIIIRGAKIVIGAVVMVIGLAKLSGVTPGIVGTAVKAAPLL